MAVSRSRSDRTRAHSPQPMAAEEDDLIQLDYNGSRDFIFSANDPVTNVTFYPDADPSHKLKIVTGYHHFMIWSCEEFAASSMCNEQKM